MSFPAPEPGLVIRYAYLWEREAAQGREEGSKDRPCAIILSLVSDQGRTIVYVLPITHAPPSFDDEAIELPAAVKRRLGLDGERSWVVITEVNAFAWPGPDLRIQPKGGPESVACGFLPPAFFAHVRDRFVALARARRVAVVPRAE